MKRLLVLWLFGALFFSSQALIGQTLPVEQTPGSENKPGIAFSTVDLKKQSTKSWEQLALEGMYTESLLVAQGASFFEQGLLAFNSQQWPQAIKHFESSIEKKEDHVDMAHHYIARSWLKQSQYKKSLASLKTSSKWAETKALKSVNQFYEAEIALKQKRWAAAERLFRKLKKTLRHNQYTPRIYFGLLASKIKQGKRSRLCSLARKVYTKYPNIEEIKDWGLVLADNTLFGRKVKCESDVATMVRRIRRLIWSGLEVKAQKDIDLFTKNPPKDLTPYDIDTLKAQFYLMEGHPKKALALMEPYKKEKLQERDFVRLYARSLSKNQKLKEAKKVYVQAAKTMKSHRHKSGFLFDAAFLDYYRQNYKSAMELFRSYLKLYPTSRRAVEVHWYIAWSQYLNKNYQDSASSFIEILKKQNTGRRSERRRWEKIPTEQIKYWLAMSFFRQGFLNKSRALFAQLTHDGQLGYYSVAAFQRLQSINQKHPITSSDPVFQVHENWWLGQIMEQGASQGQSFVMQRKEEGAVYREPSQEETMSEDFAVSHISQEALSKSEEAEFKSRLQRALKRSLPLRRYGDVYLGRQELKEVEGKRLNDQQMKWLIETHEKGESYNRMAILAYYAYQNKREKLGLLHGRDIWEHSFPKAFEPLVKDLRKKSHSVEPEFVWSIIRAETLYRASAVSPVGARGLMQIMPKTGRKIAEHLGQPFYGEDLFHPYTAVNSGQYYLWRLLKQFNQYLPLAAAAYNGGPHRVHAWWYYFGNLDMDEFIDHIPYRETRNYVKKVTRYYATYKLLYSKDTETTSFLAQPIDLKLSGTIPTKELWETVN